MRVGVGLLGLSSVAGVKDRLSSLIVRMPLRQWSPGEPVGPHLERIFSPVGHREGVGKEGD